MEPKFKVRTAKAKKYPQPKYDVGDEVFVGSDTGKPPIKATITKRVVPDGVMTWFGNLLDTPAYHYRFKANDAIVGYGHCLEHCITGIHRKPKTLAQRPPRWTYDPHILAAAEMFGVEPWKVSGPQRTEAKKLGALSRPHHPAQGSRPCGHSRFRVIQHGSEAGKVCCLTPGCEQRYMKLDLRQTVEGILITGPCREVAIEMEISKRRIADEEGHPLSKAARKTYMEQLRRTCAKLVDTHSANCVMLGAAVFVPEDDPTRKVLLKPVNSKLLGE